MSNNENQSIRKCQVSGCSANSSVVVVYSARRSKDYDKYNQWVEILKPADPSHPIVYACQRHFPAGAPTKNNPDPDPNLFNPIPKVFQRSLTAIEGNTVSLSILDESTEDRIIGSDGKPLPSAVCPPPGSVLKLAPNATLIDLKKIKERRNFNKPIRIEEVTVMIDEKDTVKVVDYGPMESSHRYNESRMKKMGRAKRRGALLPSSWDDGGNVDDFWDVGNEPLYQDYQDIQDRSLGFVLERMRLLHIDCNTAIVDAFRRKIVYAHRAVLVARSPYFYRQMYLRRKKYKCLYEFCRFTLPIEVDFEALEAVVSFIYTGALILLRGKKVSSVRKLLALFEMNESLENYNREIATSLSMEDEMVNGVKTEPMEEGEEEEEEEEDDDDDEEEEDEEEEEGVESVTVMPFVDDEEGKTPVIEVNARPELRRKRRTTEADPGSEDFRGKLKVSVQKIVDNALNPFLGKIEELFDPASSTLQIAQTSQHIITLWHADILLTKLFDQNDLTKFFSDVMNEVLGKNAVQVKIQNDLPPENGLSYTVETLFTQTGNPIIDDSYTKPYLGGPIDTPIDQPIQTLTVGDMQIINYNQLPPKHVSKYVHMIAMYRFNIFMKKDIKLDRSTEEDTKDSLMPALLEGGVLADNASAASDIEDLVKQISQEDAPITHFKQVNAPITRACFKQVNVDLKRKVVADLELYVNPSFHEELIMHIIVDQMNGKNVLPLSMGIFLAKGCNFCRKKECKAEDLTIPISPDNPVCPDRQCIKRNLQCDICNKQMSTSKSLARHKYGVHDIETGETAGLFICSHCGETFSKKWKLNIHEREHEDRKMELTCRYCKKKIRGSIALKKHITMVHEAKAQYSCEYCPKLFKRRETLNVHRRIHTGEKPFRCYHCEYASETKGNLKAHIIRKHKLQLVSFNEASEHMIANAQQTQIITDQTHVIGADAGTPSAADQVMAATIVAHSLSDGSFIITSETNPNAIVP